MVSSRIQRYFLRILTSLSKSGEPDDTIGGCLDFFGRILPVGYRDPVPPLRTPLRSPVQLPSPYRLASSLSKNIPHLACFLHSRIVPHPPTTCCYLRTLY